MLYFLHSTSVLSFYIDVVLTLSIGSDSGLVPNRRQAIIWSNDAVSVCVHDDVIRWKHFPRYWPFVWDPPVTGEFPQQRPVTRSFDAFFDLRLNKRLSKQSWGWWFETPSFSLWRHCNGINHFRAETGLFRRYESIQWLLGPILLKWINFNPSMNNLSHPL